MDFAAQLKEFEKMTNQKADKVFRQTCLQLSNDIIFDTPVDKGRARGNWFPEIDSYDTSTGEELGGDKSLQRVINKVASLEIGNTFTLSNNLNYIVPLEYGHSKQAPVGMVRKNLARFEFILKSANKG